MKKTHSIWLKRLRFFGRSESASATVEAVLWMPAFILITALLVDSSLIFSGKALILRVVQDANRSFSIGRITTPAAVESLIKLNLATLSANVTVSTVVTDGIINTSAWIPVGDLTSLGLIDELNGLTVRVNSMQMSEY